MFRLSSKRLLWFLKQMVESSKHLTSSGSWPLRRWCWGSLTHYWSCVSSDEPKSDKRGHYHHRGLRVNPLWPCPTLTRSVEVIWGKMWVEGKDFKDFSDLMKVQLGQPYVLRDFFTCVCSFSWFFKLLRLPWPGWGPTQTHWFYTLNPISLTWEKCCTTYFVINLDFVIGGKLPWSLDLKLCMSTV